MPRLSLKSDTNATDYDGSVTLSWSSSDASSCTASGDWSGSKSTSGSQTISSLTADSSFMLNCTGAGGNADDTVNVAVGSLPAPTVSLSTNSTSISYNGSTTLSWSSSDASSCTASGDWSGSKSTSGSQTISELTIDSSFILSCTGGGGNTDDSVNVSVVLNNNGTALLSWLPPTENTDESALNDLAGYKIYYGTAPGNYTDSVSIDNPGLSSYLIEGLPLATWYFAMTSINVSNIESQLSGEVTKVIN
ncbi:MAG: hypothetical protein GY744_02905 [Gammaproteobacteria bacterium]|nr:hypothetical protein [Gammaproteobacteria bacterium]